VWSSVNDHIPLGMIGRSAHRLATTEAAKSEFRHRSHMKSHLILELFGALCEISVTDVTSSGLSKVAAH
jgi:hypothetical protein